MTSIVARPVVTNIGNHLGQLAAPADDSVTRFSTGARLAMDLGGAVVLGALVSAAVWATNRKNPKTRVLAPGAVVGATSLLLGVIVTLAT